MIFTFLIYSFINLFLLVLLLFSRIDPLCDFANMFRLVETWHRQGSFVMSRCWPDAPHVQLFRNYPQEYTDLIDSFMTSVNAWNKRN